MDTVDADYKNTGYKNIPDVRASYWKTVGIYHVQIMPVIRTRSLTVNNAYKNILDM